MKEREREVEEDKKVRNSDVLNEVKRERKEIADEAHAMHRYTRYIERVRESEREREREKGKMTIRNKRQ
jgi:hypothetical protein